MSLSTENCLFITVPGPAWFQIFFKLDFVAKCNTITNADIYYRVRSGLFKSSLLQRRAFITLETSAKHHIPRATNISTFVDQTHIQRTRPRRKTGFFQKLVFHCLKAARQDAAKKSWLFVCLRVLCLFDFLRYCIASSKKFRRKFQASCNMASRFSITDLYTSENNTKLCLYLFFARNEPRRFILARFRYHFTSLSDGTSHIKQLLRGGSRNFWKRGPRSYDL